MADYAYGKQADGPFDEVQKRVEAELAQEGFGIVSRIDMRERLKEKLGIDFPRYVILGACSPSLAKGSLDAEREIGLLLPCNVIVYEDDGRTRVSAIRPTRVMKMVGNEALDGIAREVEAKLQRALDRV
ncbi:MAG: DUF302 domain-containing protein [Candidatus Bipolaricaulia bacterium]